MGSGDVFSTLTLNWTGPPGSAMVAGSADLVTTMLGGASVMATLAPAVSERALPSSSVAAAVMVSLSTSPASPLTSALKEQL